MFSIDGDKLLLHDDVVRNVVFAIHDQRPISSLSHNFYRYPATLSPWIARAIINTFSGPGELVIDPFVGGGTTIVEARAQGRRSIGSDISSLAVFVTRAKTNIYSDLELTSVEKWANGAEKLVLRISRPDFLSEHVYLRNMNGRRFAPIRKQILIFLESIDQTFPAPKARQLARCVLLRTAQWALDCRRIVPSVSEFRAKLTQFACELTAGAREFRIAAMRSNENVSRDKPTTAQVQQMDVADFGLRIGENSPSLILTSPPYPGVHVLYHRWQLDGRRESPLPFLIAGSKDGQGESYYTMGSRKSATLDKYYEKSKIAYQRIRSIMTKKTLFVQVLAFSEPIWQLPELLAVMKQSNLREVIPLDIGNGDDGRLWRSIPNRKFYTDLRGPNSSRREVIMFHVAS